MIRDLVGCEIDAKPSNYPSGLVWLDVSHDEEIDQHAMTADAAEALAAELVEAAQQARSAQPADARPLTLEAREYTLGKRILHDPTTGNDCPVCKGRGIVEADSGHAGFVVCGHCGGYARL